MKKIDYREHAFRVSLYASVVSVLIVLSFKDYFLFVPFSNGVDFLSVMGAFSLLGWVSLVVAPPLLLSNQAARWTSSKKWLLVAAASLWTFSTLLIKIYGLAVTGQLWANYLIVYPVLIFFEWVLPVYYVLLAFKLAKELPTRPVASEEPGETKAVYPQA
jgi:hypothetical protein